MVWLNWSGNILALFTFSCSMLAGWIVLQSFGVVPIVLRHVLMVPIVLHHVLMVYIALQHVLMVNIALQQVQMFPIVPSDLWSYRNVLSVSPPPFGTICFIIPGSGWTDVKTIKVSVKTEVEMTKY